MPVTKSLPHLNVFKGPVLYLFEIDAATYHLPQDKLDAITELRVGYLKDNPTFFPFLARFPNVTSLVYRPFREAALPPHVDDNVVPLLKRYKGPLAVIQLLVPGRPLEDIDANIPPAILPAAGGWPLIGEVVASLATGSGTMRHLRLGPCKWSKGCVEEIAALFPDLESLELEVSMGVHDSGNPQSWLESHLVDVTAHLKHLQTFKLWGGPAQELPSDQSLEVQLEALREARSSQRVLSSVSFQRDIIWTANLEGHWTATYSGYVQRKIVLLSPLDYLPAREALGPRVQLQRPTEDSGGFEVPSLPAELLFQIIISVASTRATLGITGGPLGTGQAVPQRTLKNLSLANEAFRSMAQPVLFDHINLDGNAPECLFRVQKLLAMLQGREESRGWIKTLHLSQLQSPSVRRGVGPSIRDTTRAQLVNAVSRFVVRLTKFTTLHAGYVNLDPSVYSHFYELPTLRSLHLTNVAFGPGINLSTAAAANLRVTDLSMQSHDQTPATTSAITRFAQSPYLRTLSVFPLSPPMLEGLLGNPPRTLPEVTEVHLHSWDEDPDRAIALLCACPNTVSIAFRGPHTTDVLEMVRTTPETIAPRLASIKGSLNASRALVPNRPVEFIEVTTPTCEEGHGPYEWSRVTLAQLAAGTVPVRELALERLRWRDDGMDILFELFPAVEVLKVHFVGDPQPYLPEHFDKVCRFKELRVLHFGRDCAGIRVALSPQLVDDAMEGKKRDALYSTLGMGSKLVEVQFEPGIHTTWRLKDGKLWERDGFIPRALHPPS